MSYLVEFVGGPHDGRTRAFREIPPGWVWVDPSADAQDRPRCFKAPTPGRMAYYALGETTCEGGVQTVAYLCAAHSHRTCEGCGALHALRDADGDLIPTCQLCGHTLQQGSAA